MVKTQTQPQQSDTQQEPEYLVATEEIGESLLLRGWNKTIEPVYEAIKQNKESGVKYPDVFVSYFNEAEPSDVGQKKRLLASTINKKTGEFITLNQLVAAGRISNDEVKLFGDRPFPRRELVQMTRHQDDSKREWLIRSETWLGITDVGSILQIGVNNIDFARYVTVRADSAPQDPTVQGSPHVRIKKIGTCLPGYYAADKIYLTPFTKDNLLAAMQKTGRPSQPSLHGHISLALSKDRSSNPCGVPDLDTFVNAEFDVLWKRQTTPQPQINISGKDLSTFVKMDRESKEEHQQYK
jgi:hypothetical protein